MKLDQNEIGFCSSGAAKFDFTVNSIICHVISKICKIDFTHNRFYTAELPGNIEYGRWCIFEYSLCIRIHAFAFGCSADFTGVM